MPALHQSRDGERPFRARITAAEDRVLEAFRRCRQRDPYRQPTVAEVATEAGCSPQTASDHILSLVAKGWLERMPECRGRAYRLTYEGAGVDQLPELLRLAARLVRVADEGDGTAARAHLQAARSQARGICAEILMARRPCTRAELRRLEALARTLKSEIAR